MTFSLHASSWVISSSFGAHSCILALAVGSCRRAGGPKFRQMFTKKLTSLCISAPRMARMDRNVSCNWTYPFFCNPRRPFCDLRRPFVDWFTIFLPEHRWHVAKSSLALILVIFTHWFVSPLIPRAGFSKFMELVGSGEGASGEQAHFLIYSALARQCKVFLPFVLRFSALLTFVSLYG